MIVNASFDPRKYAILLAQTLPAMIETEADNERMLKAVNQRRVVVDLDLSA